MFLCGSLMASDSRANKILLWSIYLLSIVLLVLITYGISPHADFIKHVLCGLVIGIHVVYALIKKNYKSDFDQLMGNLSYGIYLIHMIFILIFSYYNIAFRGWVLLVMIIASTILAYFSYRFIELPVARYRHLYRNKYAN